MRNDQNLNHTMSRKGYACLEYEMLKESSGKTSLTRVNVWTRGHTKKNGEPINEEVGVALPSDVGNNLPKPSVLENAKCHILHWYNLKDEEIVAEGRISSIDPSSTVHGLPLGRNNWRVWVDVAFNSDFSLVRQNDETKTLGEAVGTTIAWPKSSIKLI